MQDEVANTLDYKHFLTAYIQSYCNNVVYHA